MILQWALLHATVHLTSDTICYDLKKKSIEAQGNVIIKYKEKTLRCDKLTFDQITKQIQVEGKAFIQEKKDQYEAYNIQTDLELKTAVADHLNILIDGVLFFKCRRGERGKDHFTFHETYFTTCNTLHPLWGLDVEKIVFNEKENRVYHYNAFIKINDKRIFPVPYLSHVGPKSDRGYGVLPIFFDPLSGDLGAVLGIPYYIPFSDTNDLTITPYGVWSYGVGLYTQYRHNITNGQLRAEGSTFKRLREIEEFETSYWHANVSFEKSSQQQLFNARLNRASHTEYLKKFWFLHDKGLIYHDPLISSARYAYLTNTGYLNTGLFWIQNHQDKKNPEFLAPIIEYEFNKGFFRGHTKNFYLEKKGLFSLTKLELYKTGRWHGALLTAKAGINCILSNSDQPEKEELFPFGTAGISYPLIHRSRQIITEPLVIVNFSKPYKNDYQDIFLKSSANFIDTSLFQHQHNTFEEKKYHAIFGLRERFLKEGCTLFLGAVKNAEEKIKHFGEITFDPTSYLSVYSHIEIHDQKVPFFETGAEMRSKHFNVHGSIAHIEEKNYTQYMLDTLIPINYKWSLRLGYLGNLKFLTNDEHKFLWYTAIHYENECLRFELGGSLDRIISPLNKQQSLNPTLEYRILLQIVPKFAKEKHEYRRYLPSSVLAGNNLGF